MPKSSPACDEDGNIPGGQDSRLVSFTRPWRSVAGRSYPHPQKRRPSGRGPCQPGDLPLVDRRRTGYDTLRHAARRGFAALVKSDGSVLGGPRGNNVELISINVGLPRLATFNGVTVSTGIFKRPVSGVVRVGRLNLQGDEQADRSVHGGIDKAVYAYPVEHYDFWKDVLNLESDFEFGQFGENLTVARMLETDICIGDVLRLGTATLQVSQPRTPCLKLGIRMKLPMFPRYFLASRRSGFYMRVIEEGEIAAGDSFQQCERDPAGITVEEMFCLYHEPQDRRAAARRALTCSTLAEDWQVRFREWLQSS